MTSEFTVKGALTMLTKNDLLVLGLLLGRAVLIVVIVFLAFLTIFTFIQRVLHVRRLTLEKDL